MGDGGGYRTWQGHRYQQGRAAGYEAWSFASEHIRSVSFTTKICMGKSLPILRRRVIPQTPMLRSLLQLDMLMYPPTTGTRAGRRCSHSPSTSSRNTRPIMSRSLRLRFHLFLWRTHRAYDPSSLTFRSRIWVGYISPPRSNTSSINVSTAIRELPRTSELDLLSAPQPSAMRAFNGTD